MAGGLFEVENEDIICERKKKFFLVLVDFFMSKPDGRYLIMKDPMKVRIKIRLI
jgi:hypothetical protein